MNAPDALTITQAAERAGIGVEGVRLAIQRGSLPATKQAGRWQITADDLDTWRASQAHIHRGEGNGNAKLTVDDIPDIRRMLETGTPITAIAKQYNVGRTTIWNIKIGRTWGWIPE